jgi:DNA polymerase-3 subunit beta
VHPRAPVIWGRCRGITWALPALLADDYPALPDLPPLAGVIDSAEFACSILRVAQAASRDDALPVLMSMQFQTRNATC